MRTTGSHEHLFKQWGEWAPADRNDGLLRIGKRKAGSLLDGVDHKAWPQQANGQKALTGSQTLAPSGKAALASAFPE